MARASAIVLASGFSICASRPARTASTPCSACWKSAVAMMTASTSLRSCSSSLFRASAGALAGALRDLRGSFLAPAAPDVGHRDDLEVQLVVVLEKRRQERLPESIGEADDAHPDAIVGADDVRVARCSGCQGRSGDARAGDFDELDVS
jgi:hypothetical protein